MMLIPWTTRERDMMVKLWQDGESAAVIAAKLGNNRTRNSVLGFLFRLRRSHPEMEIRFESQQSRPRQKNTMPVVRHKKPKPEPVVQINLFTPIEEVPSPDGGVPYFETRLFQCKYILNTSGDPHNVKCCGASVYRLTSWCKDHYYEVFTERTSHGTQVGHLSSGKTPVASKFQFRRM